MTRRILRAAKRRLRLAACALAAKVGLGRVTRRGLAKSLGMEGGGDPGDC